MTEFSCWEIIGSCGPVAELNDTDNVPKWIRDAYSKKRIHHENMLYIFTGKHYLYKVSESGQGGGYRTFYRKLKCDPVSV
jgi:hypothetical protein